MNFLDLIDILIKSPDSMKREEKIEDCNMLFIHMHHLINEFRPHQARETLRVMLHVQKRKRMQVAQKFQANLDKVSSDASATFNFIGHLINKPQAEIRDHSNSFSSSVSRFSRRSRTRCRVSPRLTRTTSCY